MAKRLVYDRWLFFTAGLLVVAGVFMVGSASYYEAMRHGLSPYAFLAKQAIHAAVGMAALVAALKMDFRLLARRWVVLSLIGVSLLLLLLVLSMPAIGGARRWVLVGPLTFQPSELVKVAVIVFMAYMLSRKSDQVNEPWAVALPCLAVIGALSFLTAIEPDLGSAVMIAALPFLMLFVAGLQLRYVAMAGALGAVAVVGAVLAEPWRLERIRTVVFGPGEDALGSGFQLTQSLIAVGSGGITGVGPGQGQQKALFLPAPHTDFIFSVIGEELGLIGTGVLLLAFLILFWRGMRTALRAPDRFGFFLALGLTNLLVLQALINMGVCLGVLPTKGIPLPFISYGGSSLLMAMIATGLLLNVSQYAD